MQINRIGLTFFCLIIAFTLSVTNAYAGKKWKRLQIANAHSDDTYETIFIYGINFGDTPQVKLEWELLTIRSSTDDYIEAILPAGIEPGTYRLAIAKKRHSRRFFPSDTMDVTIGAAGPPGADGAQGPQGIQGAPGPMGPQGIQGEQGPIGAQGVQGFQGPKGDQGVQGERGPQGPIGFTGAQGPTGATGPKGDTGATGAQGMQGMQGDQGPAGIQGEQGPAGLKGDQGEQGPQGEPGADGNGVYTGTGWISVDNSNYTVGLNPATNTGDLMTWDGDNWVASPPEITSIPDTDGNMQPWIGMSYIIALTGVYPSRNSMDPFIGEIIMFAGNFAPRGWAFCDGQLLLVGQYQALFSILGTTYGGDGRTTFALPDLRGRTAIHWGKGDGLRYRSLGLKGGLEDSHRH